MNRTLIVAGASVLLGLVAQGRDANAAPGSRVVVGVQAQAAPAACTADLREGVVYEDHEKHPDPACKAKIAEHNKRTWMARAASAMGAAKTEAEAHVRMWQHAFGVATIAQAQKELREAKGAAIANAEKRLHAAIDAHERDIERHAQEAKAKLLEIESAAKHKVDELKKKYEAAVGQTKHALEADWLTAEHTLKRVEEVLATNELKAAEHKLQAASQRIGAEAAQLKARAQAEYNQIKAKVDAIHRRVRAEISQLESRIKNTAAQISSAVHHLKDEVNHVEHALKNVFHGLFG